MNDSEDTQPLLAQETDEQALQEHLPVLEEERLEEVMGGVGSSDPAKISYKDYMKAMDRMLSMPRIDNPLKRTAARAGLPDNLQPNKLQKVQEPNGTIHKLFG